MAGKNTISTKELTKTKNIISKILKEAETDQPEVELKRMVADRIKQDRARMPVQKIFDAFGAALQKVQSMSPEERGKVAHQYFGSSGITTTALGESVLKESLGWDDVILGYAAIILFAMYHKVPMMHLVKIFLLAAEVILKMPYIVLRKLFQGRDFNAYDYIDRKVWNVIDS